MSEMACHGQLTESGPSLSCRPGSRTVICLVKQNLTAEMRNCVLGDDLGGSGDSRAASMSMASAITISKSRIIREKWYSPNSTVE